MSRDTQTREKAVVFCSFSVKPLACSIFDRLLPKGRKKEGLGWLRKKLLLSLCQRK